MRFRRNALGTPRRVLEKEVLTKILSHRISGKTIRGGSRSVYGGKGFGKEEGRHRYL